MITGAENEFADLLKAAIDRICEERGFTRKELADDLGVTVLSISTVGYRGNIGFPLISRIAKMAGLDAEEMADLEMAWIRLRSSRNRDGALRRSVDIIDVLLDQVMTIEEWMKKKGVFEKYKKTRARDALLKRMRRLMREEEE